MATNFYTFWTLLKDEAIKSIQIPIIQRDYAQGRQEAKTDLIRSRFLEALYEAVAEQQPLVLDFVYGELEGGDFVPLDGQQRLTTLFLLHWYLALVEGKLTEIQPLLSKFTYETRISSREFCEALVSEKGPERAGFGALSEAIWDTAWFQPAWKRDPTVAAMLTMLDALEKRFGKTSGWLERLQDEAKPLVGFYFLNMPETGLSDDLYLKMNARGKALTEFENWKAEFDLFLQRQHPGTGQDSLQQVFGQKLDGQWTDFFWKYRRKGTAEIDGALEQYLHYVTRMLAYQRSATGEKFEDLTKERLSFACFEQVYKQPEAVHFLFGALDFLSWAGNTPEGLIGLFGRLLTEQAKPGRVRLFGEKVNLVEQCLQGLLTRQGEVLLFSLLSLAAMNGGQLADEEEACDLLRVLRNLLERVRQQNETKLNSNLRANDLPAFTAAVGVLAAGMSGVYAQLADGVQLPTLSGQSVEYEREKALLLKADKLSKPVLQTLEDQAVLRGDLHNLYLPKHADRAADFAQAMNELWPEGASLPQELLIQAWLTRGDYSVVSRGTSTQLGEKFFFGNVNNWYTLLANDQIKPGESLLPGFLEAYLEAPGADATHKLKHMAEAWLASNAGTMDWRYYFIKYPEMSAKSTGYYAWADASDFKVRLLSSTTLKGRHISPYVRAIVWRGLTEDVVGDEEDQVVNGNNPSPLWLYNIPGVPAGVKSPKLHCEDYGWALRLAAGCTLGEELIKGHSLQDGGQDSGDGIRWLKGTKTDDRIEQAEAFIADLHRLGVQYTEPAAEATIEEAGFYG